ncbi:unnamed protein product [Paramecium primaurelia]|uniref:Uncharacterized protein n=1 Tax=Paramecium primaurelia TaxID=5886 RepID=A0A8S1N0B4_PARPR|nr:unnamed protein product [Paramecium primaurelia]CAD8082535.1 unnamed protein product [Paramecium primaurelia]
MINLKKVAKLNFQSFSKRCINYKRLGFKLFFRRIISIKNIRHQNNQYKAQQLTQPVNHDHRDPIDTALSRAIHRRQEMYDNPNEVQRKRYKQIRHMHWLTLQQKPFWLIRKKPQILILKVQRLILNVNLQHEQNSSFIGSL